MNMSRRKGNMIGLKGGKKTKQRAMIDAKVNDTIIVYKTDNGELVKEYPSGKIV